MLTALCLVTLLQWLVQKQHMKHTSLQHFVTVWWLMLCSRSYSPHQQYSVQLSSLDVRGGSHSSTWSQWVYFAYYLGNCLFYHWATVQNFLNSSFILTQTFRMEMRLLPALRKWGSQQKGFCFELKNKTHINISRSRKKKRKDWEIFSTSSQWTSDNRCLVLLEQQVFFFSCHVNFKHNILYFFDISHLFELFLFCFCFIFYSSSVRNWGFLSFMSQTDFTSSLFPYINKQPPNKTSSARSSFEPSAIKRCSHYVSAGFIKPVTHRNRCSWNLSQCHIYINALKGGQCSVSAFGGIFYLFIFFEEQMTRSGAGVLLVCDSNVWGLWGVRVVGGACISCCLASVRVKGSGREA